jgi:hypothetical protein
LQLKPELAALKSPKNTPASACAHIESNLDDAMTPRIRNERPPLLVLAAVATAIWLALTVVAPVTLLA